MLNLWAQPVPHHLSGVSLGPGQSVELSLEGSVSGMFNLTGTISNQFRQMFDIYPVEASSNLTDWTSLAHLLKVNSDSTALMFQDTNAAVLIQRFYRTPTNILLTTFPQPSGPFPVGVVDRVMSDPARTNRYRYSPPTNAFMVTLWYPAAPSAAGALPELGRGKRLWQDPRLYSIYGLDQNWGKISAAAAGHALPASPVSAQQAQYPVLLFSHGLCDSRHFHSQVAEELASHGYVVVAPDHTDCFGTDFADGPYLVGTSRTDLSGIDNTNRFKDFQFLLDELARLQSGDRLFAGRLDLDRVGIYGMSAGGMSAEMCRRDDRLKCVALLDAVCNLQLPSTGLQKPFLCMDAPDNPCLATATWLFSKAVTNATSLMIRNSNHQTFSDAAWAMQIPQGPPMAAAINECLVWFFDTYLKNQTPPFPTNPQIYNVQRK